MKVQVYIPKPSGVLPLEYLLLPYGETRIPPEVEGTGWRKFFTREIDSNGPDAMLREAAEKLLQSGYALVPVRKWTKRWSEIGPDELGLFEEPDGWQDSFYGGWPML